MNSSSTSAFSPISARAHAPSASSARRIHTSVLAITGVVIGTRPRPRARARVWRSLLWRKFAPKKKQTQNLQHLQTHARAQPTDACASPERDRWQAHARKPTRHADLPPRVCDHARRCPEALCQDQSQAHARAHAEPAHQAIDNHAAGRPAQAPLRHQGVSSVFKVKEREFFKHARAEKNDTPSR